MLYNDNECNNMYELTKCSLAKTTPCSWDQLLRTLMGSDNSGNSTAVLFGTFSTYAHDVIYVTPVTFYYAQYVGILKCCNY